MKSTLTPEERAALGLTHKDTRDDVRLRAQEAARVASQANRDARMVPAEYGTLDALLTALCLRCDKHPRRVPGVAAEMRSPRRSVQYWLEGRKMPSEERMRKMAEVIALPLPTVIPPAMRSAISSEAPTLRKRKRHCQWAAMLEQWHVGEGLDIAHSASANFRAAATRAGQKVKINAIDSRTDHATRLA